MAGFVIARSSLIGTDKNTLWVPESSAVIESLLGLPEVTERKVSVYMPFILNINHEMQNTLFVEHLHSQVAEQGRYTKEIY